jgi:H+-transporting ATPase
MTTDAPHVAPSPAGGAAGPVTDLKSGPLAQVEIHLGYSPDGLSTAEAASRLAQYGPNEIVEHKTNPLLKFLSYFWGPIPLANGAVGYTEERQAGNAIEALKAKLAINARVIRNGKWIAAPARELVPGDVIRLRLGDIVPADARLGLVAVIKHAYLLGG